MPVVRQRDSGPRHERRRRADKRNSFYAFTIRPPSIINLHVRWKKTATLTDTRLLDDKFSRRDF
jgi:hypothetical protein